MKKVISMMALVAFLCSMNTNAQEKPREKKKAKTEKKCTPAEMKSCDKTKKTGCCAKK